MPYSEESFQLSKIISRKVEYLKNTYDVNHDSKNKLSYNKWSEILIVKAIENFELTLIEAIKKEIDPFLLTETKRDYFIFIGIFKKFMKNSLSNLSNVQRDLFPDGMLSKLQAKDYLFLLKEVCNPKTGLDRSYLDNDDNYILDCDDDEYLIDLSYFKNSHISCNFCGNCKNCMEYGKHVKLFLENPVFKTNYYTYANFNSILPFNVSLVEKFTLNNLARSISEKLKTQDLKLSDIAYKKIFLRDILYVVNDADSKSLESQRIDRLQQYLYLFKSNSYHLMNQYLENHVSIFHKEIYLKRILNHLSPFRYLPLYEVMGEWDEMSPYISNNNFSLDSLTELVIDLAPRIFALSCMVENLLQDKNDELFYIVKEINDSIKNDNFILAQAGIATVIGLIRDNRCQKYIKNISKGHTDEVYLEIIEKSSSDSNTGINLISTFLHTKDIIPEDRQTSLNRHGTVHGGMNYYSKFNAIGLLLIQSKLIMGMYNDMEDANFKMFRPMTDW